MSRQILVAHSNATFAENCCDYLRRSGLMAARAGTGIQCMQMLHASPPALLIVDLDLLWGGGDGVLAEMATHPSLNRVRTVVLVDSPSQMGWIQPSEMTALQPLSGKRDVPGGLANFAIRLLQRNSDERKPEDVTKDYGAPEARGIRNAITKFIEGRLRDRIQNMEITFGPATITVAGKVQSHNDRLRAIAAAWDLTARLSLSVRVRIEVSPLSFLPMR